MRRQFIPQAAKTARSRITCLLLEKRKFPYQPIDLLLLPHDHQVQLIEQVFGEAGLDFQFGDAGVVKRDSMAVLERGLAYNPSAPMEKPKFSIFRPTNSSACRTARRCVTNCTSRRLSKN